MFDIGWTELVVIAVVAIVVIGPKDLPRALRTFGQWSGRVKRMAREFQGQFNEALREAELDGVQKEIESIGKIDPLKGVRSEMAKLDNPVMTQTVVPDPAAPAPPAAPVPAEPPKVEP